MAGIISCAGLLAQGGEASPKPRALWTSTIQTGLADTFQLTLGGTFGRGPAWQSRLETGIANPWKNGDSIYVYFAESLDTDSVRSDWQAGMEYRRPVWRRGRQQLIATGGLQHWKFANVKTGTNDWLTHENLTYRAAVGPVGLHVTSDSWSLLKSPLPTGSLLHTQIWAEHRLLTREPVSVAFRHGPAHTHSWGFYGTNGHRVVRYQTMLAVTLRGVRMEAGFRKQIGLQPGIPDNPYWQFSVARTWSH